MLDTEHMATNVRERPNVVLIYADDLGRGMLSCYGQKHFQTPNIDRIAGSGIRFTHAYGCVFCAPARASLLVGRHDCHAGAWSITRGGIYKKITTDGLSHLDICELINHTGIQAGEDDVFLPQLFQQAGYVTGQVGKLEWGFATTPQRLARHGWDYHYGYYDHCRCHGFYPPFLFEDGRRIDIPGNTHADCGKHPEFDGPGDAKIRHDMTGKSVYSQDLFDEKLRAFIQQNGDRPFFLYHPSQLPHGPISIPELHPDIADHPDLTQYEKEYASMILRLDRTVGIIWDELEAAGIVDNTVVIFCADNGHEFYCRQPGRTGDSYTASDGTKIDNIVDRFTSERCGDVFNGNDGMAGLKVTNWEGGARIPYLVSWPGQTPPGTVSAQRLANYDLFPTFAELLGLAVPPGKDGVSLLPVWQGKAATEAHDIVYASFYWGPSLVTPDGWKLRRINKLDLFQLYYLPDDYAEARDLADEHPEKVAELAARLLAACDGDYANGHISTHLVAYDEDAVNRLESQR